MKKITFAFTSLLFVSSFYSCDSSENIGNSANAREARFNSKEDPIEIKNNDSIPKKTLKYNPK